MIRRLEPPCVARPTGVNLVAPVAWHDLCHAQVSDITPVINIIASNPRQSETPDNSSVCAARPIPVRESLSLVPQRPIGLLNWLGWAGIFMQQLAGISPRAWADGPRREILRAIEEEDAPQRTRRARR